MATNPYVNKVVYGNDTVMDLTSDTATPSDVLLGATFHDRSGAPQTGSLDLGEYTTIDLLKETVGWTGKNLLGKPFSSGTVGGVTFTLNSDRTYSLSGTATENIFFKIVEIADAFVLPTGSYTFSGGSSNDVFLFLINTSTGTTVAEAKASEVSFTLNADTTVRLSVFVNNGTNTSGITLYPMLRKATISDSTYEPYHQTVEDCKYNRSEANALGAKNLIPVPYKSGAGTYTSGITFVINDDGSVTASGTASADTTFYFVDNTIDGVRAKFLKMGKMILSGGLSNDVRLQFWNAKSDDAVVYDTGSGTTVEFTNTSDYFNCVLRIANGTSLTTPVTIKPLLRLASDPDNVYVPYAMTNKELTDKKADKTEIHDATLTITKNGNIVGTFSANASTNVTIPFLDDYWLSGDRIFVSSSGTITFEVPISGCIIGGLYFDISQFATNKNPHYELTSMTVTQDEQHYQMVYSTDAAWMTEVMVRLLRA